jgi:hypothetical protein
MHLPLSPTVSSFTNTEMPTFFPPRRLFLEGVYRSSHRCVSSIVAFLPEGSHIGL